LGVQDPLKLQFSSLISTKNNQIFIYKLFHSFTYNLKTMIFKLKLITILTAILLLSSCAKEELDCKESLFGTYSGTQTCIDNTNNSYTYTSSLMISESVQENKVVVTISGTSFVAEVSSDCSSVNIVSQTYNNGGGFSTINGNFIVNGNSLTGNFSSVDSWSSNNCAFNLTQL
jgi:hypothetical protein